MEMEQLGGELKFLVFFRRTGYLLTSDFKCVYLLGVINKNRNILDNYQESKVSKKYIFNSTGVKKGKQ